MTINKAQLLYAAIATSILVLSIIPALRDPRDDDYPFSTYPMFGGRRKTPTFYKAEGKDARGQWVPVAVELFGTSEVMQAVMTVQRSARTPRGARTLCHQLARAKPSRHEEIRVIKVTYDPVKYFTEGPKPQSRQVLARCDKPSRTNQWDQEGRRR